MTLTWEKSSGRQQNILTYRIVGVKSLDGSSIVTTAPGERSLAFVTGLSESSAYSFSVVAISRAGPGEPGPASSLVTTASEDSEAACFLYPTSHTIVSGSLLVTV